jgi:hypothetical protein
MAQSEAIKVLQDQEAAAKLAIDVRIFDRLTHNDINLARSMLADEIDSTLVLLYIAQKDHTLDSSTKFLFESALKYRRQSNELDREASTNVWAGIPISRVVGESR